MTTKNFLRIITVSLYLVSFNAYSIVLDDGDTWECTKIHDPVPVRYMKVYSFNNTWNNKSSHIDYLHDFFVKFRNGNFLKGGKNFKDGSFISWTKEIKDASYGVAPYSSMKYIETFAEDWGIAKKPTKRADITKKEYDFLIAYRTHYDQENNTAIDAQLMTDISCQPYYVTWLGDGVIDERYEKCDPADPMKTGWGKNGCNNKSGEPIN